MSELSHNFMQTPTVRASWPARTDPTASKIRSFADLPKGWHLGDGGPIAKRVVDAALKWRGLLAEQGVYEADVSPSEHGSILLAAFISGKYTEIISEPNGKFTITRDQRPERPLYRSRLSEAEARNLIHQMLGEPCNTFVGFIRLSFSPNSDGLEVTLSKTTQAAIPRGSHWWNATASDKDKRRHALMR